MVASASPGGGLVWGVSGPGGSGPGGVLPLGGVSGPGGVWSWGGLLRGRGSSPCPGGFPLPGDPPVNRITDTCKNITLATTSLRPVNISSG